MKLVLDRWQGLGDNLQVSTIPRRYYEKYGEKCVWISNEIRYRNPEIKQLVWEDNPYIAGFTDEPGENLTHKIPPFPIMDCGILIARIELDAIPNL